MTGAPIDIVSGTTLRNVGWQKEIWTDNLATLQVDGELELNDGNAVMIDALTRDTTQTFEYGTPLGAGSWTPVAIPGGTGVSVTDQGAGIDKVEITVAKGAETKLFGRLQVVKQSSQSL